MKRILIIEDEPGVQMTLEDRLVVEGYDVTIKGDGLQGEIEALKKTYDIILLDIMLPLRDGYAVCNNIRKAGVDTPVLMLTARNTNMDTVIGLRQGADDYLAKPFDMSVLLARIEALLRRSSKNTITKTTDLKQVSFGKFILYRDKGTLYKEGTEIPLVGQEFRLLSYLTANSNTIISRNTLMDAVWGYDNETTSRTVDVHIAKLRQKLEESESHGHIMTIRGRGYKFIL